MEAPPHQLLVSQSPYNSNRYSHRGEGGGPVELSEETPHAKNGESSTAGERLRRGEIGCLTLDSNLASLCDHIHTEGFNNGVFSDVVLNAMGSTYCLHRLIISRSSYFRNMLHGPWKEANSPNLTLHVDDKNVDSEAIEITLAYMYGNYPKLDNTKAFRVLAAASFLDLQDLCAICTDFIIAELCSSNFLTYQVFAENQDYGRYGERVRNACWGYLCQSAALELKEVLPKVSPQTLLTLLTSDELWVPSEEKRFELALYTLLAKGTNCIVERPDQGHSNSEEISSTHSDFYEMKNQRVVDESTNNFLETERGHPKSEHDVGGSSTAHNIGLEMGNSVTDSHSFVAQDGEAQSRCSKLRSELGYNSSSKQTSAHDIYCIDISASSSFLDIQIDGGMSGSTDSGLTLEGPSAEDPCYQLNNTWSAGDQLHCMPSNSSCDVFTPNEWERCNMPPLTWGGRTVARREVKACQRQCGMSREDYDAFMSIFEGGSLLYCNMSFEALLNVRKHLEEMGFPCKAVNDGLWLQMLLSQLVHEIGVATCKNCCLVSTACSCRQSFGYSRGVTALGCYMQDHDPSNLANDIGHVYITSPAQGERSDTFRLGRGNGAGLAGIGHGTTFVPATAWPPTRYVFSRVPFGIGNRNNQQAPANDDPDNRAGNPGDLNGDGLTTLVGLNLGPTDITNVHELQIAQAFEAGPESIMTGSLTPGPSTSGIHVQVIDSTEQAARIDWENVNNSISLDLKTPLSHFPPFRFAVEFQDVQRLSDGQVKHSPEVFYAGSLWKISVQAFSDEDPQGRRTLGLFLHRRKAEISEQLRKVHMYVDPREKVTARYQLICPSKREVMIFGSYKQSGTLLPKAPKGWGWRTALVFNQLGDLLQNGALRIAAVVQLV